jgi:hypothetical protein
MEMSALSRLLRFAHPSLSTRRSRQEMKQKYAKGPSPCVLDAVLVERVPLVGKVELGFTAQVGKIEFRGVKGCIESLSVEYAGATETSMSRNVIFEKKTYHTRTPAIIVVTLTGSLSKRRIISSLAFL